MGADGVCWPSVFFPGALDDVHPRHGHCPDRHRLQSAGRRPARRAQPQELLMKPVLQVANYSMEFTLPGGRRLHALNGIDLQLAKGEVLGVVGESGSGKTTLCWSIKIGRAHV